MQQPRTKKCSKCKETKDTSGFSRNKKGKDGLNSWCRSCAHANFLRHKVLMRFQGNKMYDGTIKTCTFCNKEWPRLKEHWNKFPFSQDWLKTRCVHCESERGLISLYGINQADKINIHKFQGGKCGICGKNLTINGDAYVDHNHEIGMGDNHRVGGIAMETRRKSVDGLLCHKCNFISAEIRKTATPDPKDYALLMLAYEADPPARHVLFNKNTT